MPILQTSRSELHKLVWSKITNDVATHLGMSDTGVAKLCDRNKVERPPRGYWLRKHQCKEPPTVLHQIEELERQRLRVIAQRLKRRKALIGKLALNIRFAQVLLGFFVH